MTFAALVLAQILRLTAPQLAEASPSGPGAPAQKQLADGAAASRYHLDDFAQSLDRRVASRYHLKDLAQSLERVATFRYQLSDLAQSLDLDRCICMTTRLSPVTFKSEVLLVSDCDCGK
jgi:hypothetical protein